MKFSVITLPEAEMNLYQSAEWWAEHRSSAQAQRWWDTIWPVIHSRSDRPQQWPLALENSDFPYEIRELHFGLGSRPNYRIIFTIQNDKVYIVAVQHAAQDRLHPDQIGPLPSD